MDRAAGASDARPAGGGSSVEDLLDFLGTAPPQQPVCDASSHGASLFDTADPALDPFAALLDLSSTDTVSQCPEDSSADSHYLDSLLDFDPFQPAPLMATTEEKAADSTQEDEWLLVEKEEADEAKREVTAAAAAAEDAEGDKDEEGKKEVKKEASPAPVITLDAVDGEKNGEDGSEMDLDGERVQMRRKPAEPTARESTSSMGSDSDRRLSRNSSTDVEADIDFSVIKDTEQLDVEVPKHKTSLRRHSSLAKRKRPTRNSMRYSIREDDDDSFFIDSTEPRPAVDDSDEDKVNNASSKEGSPAAEDQSKTSAEPPRKPPPGAGRRLLPSGLDLSKIKRRKESSSSPSDDDEKPPALPSQGPPSVPSSKTTPTKEGEKPSAATLADKSSGAEEKSAGTEANSSVETEKPPAPRKPPAGVRPNLMMPGMQDLTKSKLFGQDRSNKDTVKAPPEKKVEEKDSTLSVPPLRSVPKPVATEKKPEDTPPKPLLKPALKPISKEQKDSQNLSTAEKQSGSDKPDAVTPSKLLGRKPAVPSKPASSPEPAPAPVLPTLRKVARDNSKEQSDGSREKSPALELPTLKKVGGPAREGSAEPDKGDSDREKTPPAWLSEMKLRKTKSPSAGGEDKSTREKTPEKPAWMKAAQDRKARTGDTAQTKENQGKPEEAKEEKVPPWLSECSLKKTAKPAPLKESNDQEEKKPPITSGRRTDGILGKSPEKETSSSKTEGDAYSPSWLKNGQNKKTEEKSREKSIEKSGENSEQGTPTSPGEVPPWKLELAQRNRNRRGSESPAKQDGAKESSPTVPDWKRELNLKKRPSAEPREIENRFNAEPEWKKKAEEKRKRLMKSGILQQK